MQTSFELFITCSKGVEDLLVRECEEQGIADAEASRGGVTCRTDLKNAYRICMWSRVASRVLLKLHEEEIEDEDALYCTVLSVDWSQHMTVEDSLAINCFTSHEKITNSQYAVLRIKDAIVDQFREATGDRPDIEKDQADIRINAYIDRSSVTLYLDLSGEPLHKRGYRLEKGMAPLRETLAAAMLYRCRWPKLASEGNSFVDIMCGSGTLLIEAALMASQTAPQHSREHFGFLAWRHHNDATWLEVRDEAAACRKGSSASILGLERSGKMLAIARENIERAGLTDTISLQQADITQGIGELPERPGLMLTNPPYGKRIGDMDELRETYTGIGRRLKSQFAGWQAAIITSEDELAQQLGLRAHRRNTLYNGALKCTLYQYEIRRSENRRIDEGLHPNAEMLLNRLKKYLKHIRKWANKRSISCYRIYDADLPQYSAAIDVYESDIVIQEYQAPNEVDAASIRRHREDLLTVASMVFEVDASNIIYRSRRKQSGKQQYDQIARTGDRREVNEGGLKFLVNLKDYLDTGLFIDHRQTRQLVGQLAEGRRVLNLFAYTGSFSVYAAAGNAESVTTVDMSKTYINWAEENMRLNGLQKGMQRFIRDDCLEWLKRDQGEYDLIILDPPTFSNSKRMEASFDIQRDHAALIARCLARLSPEGVLLFSTNARKFKLDEGISSAHSCKEITSMTTTEDFRRKPLHRCWCIKHSGTECHLPAIS